MASQEKRSKFETDNVLFNSSLFLFSLTEIPRSIPASVSLCSARASRSLRDSERREAEEEEEDKANTPRLAHPAATAKNKSRGHAAAARATNAAAAASTASARATTAAPRANNKGPGAHAAQMATAGKETTAAAASGARKAEATTTLVFCRGNEDEGQRRHCFLKGLFFPI